MFLQLIFMHFFIPPPTLSCTHSVHPTCLPLRLFYLPPACYNEPSRQYRYAPVTAAAAVKSADRIAGKVSQ